MLSDMCFGAHLVVVPYDSLKLVENKIVLTSGTKETLKCCLSSSTPRSDSAYHGIAAGGLVNRYLR